MSSKQEPRRLPARRSFARGWSVLDARATVTVFNDHLADSDAAVALIHFF
jgi:hypothetical protein